MSMYIHLKIFHNCKLKKHEKVVIVNFNKTSFLLAVKNI